LAGRTAKPTTLINMTNRKVNKIGKDKLDARAKAEPKAKSAFLKCPDRLNEAAASEWHRIVALYREFENEIMNDLDEDMLMVYCEAVVTYKLAMDKVKDTAAVYKSPKDAEPKINPWLTVANSASDIMRKNSDMLLLNPVSRARAGLAIAKASEEALSPMASFLKNRSK
jgi:P27 family predicted phage terminase small subunit